VSPRAQLVLLIVQLSHPYKKWTTRNISAIAVSCTYLLFVMTVGYLLRTVKKNVFLNSDSTFDFCRCTDVLKLNKTAVTVAAIKQLGMVAMLPSPCMTIYSLLITYEVSQSVM